ncbi:MAG: FadR/GntR family transcriptional regulator [Nocardioidaceae bacterium]
MPASPTVPVERQLRELLTKGVDQGRFAPGTKLPTERELAELLVAPRSAIRRALAALERDELIMRHVGRGTFVADAATPTQLRAPADTSPAEIMQARMLLEPQIAQLAARVARQVDLDRIEHCLQRGGTTADYAEFEAWDGQLHRAVAQAAHNALLLNLFDTMNAARNLPVWGSLKKRSFTPDRRCRYDADHTTVVEALRDRNPSAAAHAMAAHLDNVTSNLLGPDHRLPVDTRTTEPGFETSLAGFQAQAAPD